MGGVVGDRSHDLRVPWRSGCLEMVMHLIIRFLIGGVVVSFFAILGDALKPKSFAGLMSAAPSVALATIGLTVLQQGKSYVYDCAIDGLG
jgi:hypothetical protein